MSRSQFEGNIYQPQYSQQLIDNVPELEQDLTNLGLTIKAIAVIVAWPNLDLEIPHIDHLVPGNLARINIPVFNCKNTYTTFYTNIQVRVEQQRNGEYFNRVINDDYIETTRVELTQPTLLRVSEPHAILINKAQGFPRVTLTILTNPDAVTLFS